MNPDNNALIYILIYATLAEVAREHGYELAVHGSLIHDLDLVAIPWTQSAADPQAVVDTFKKKFSLRDVGEIGAKEHGRIVYTLSAGFSGAFIGLSFMPRMLAETPSVVRSIATTSASESTLGNEMIRRMQALNAWLDSLSEKGGVWLDWVPDSFLDAWDNADVLLDQAHTTDLNNTAHTPIHEIITCVDRNLL